MLERTSAEATVVPPKVEMQLPPVPPALQKYSRYVCRLDSKSQIYQDRWSTLHDMKAPSTWRSLLARFGG